MSALLTLLMLVILAACLGMLYREGMWSCGVLFVNVVTAALLATNVFEPIASWLADSLPDYTYIWDYVALWGSFVAILFIFQNITNRVSKVKVRFLQMADQIGSGIFAFLIGWVMICFTMMSLHTAPLSKEFLFGGFNSSPDRSMFLGLAPDRKWLGFMQYESRGALSQFGEPNEFPKDFISKYETRRAEIEENLFRTEGIRRIPLRRVQ